MCSLSMLLCETTPTEDSTDGVACQSFTLSPQSRCRRHRDPQCLFGFFVQHVLGGTWSRSSTSVPTPARTFFSFQYVLRESMESLGQDCPNTCSTFLLSLQHVLGKVGAAHSGVIQHLLSFFSFVDMCCGNLESLVQDCSNTRRGSLSRSNMYWGNAESLVHDCSNTCSDVLFFFQYVLGEVWSRSFRTVPTPGRLFFSRSNMCWGKLEPLGHE